MPPLNNGYQNFRGVIQAAGLEPVQPPEEREANFWWCNESSSAWGCASPTHPNYRQRICTVQIELPVPEAVSPPSKLQGANPDGVNDVKSGWDQAHALTLLNKG